MRHRKRIAVLLTATVDPKGCVRTKLQDVAARRQQYIDALTFYLTKTDLPVVFCENSGCDFSGLFQEYIDRGRLEYFCFYGNERAATLGKGYGEAKIIMYAIDNSQILRGG